MYDNDIYMLQWNTITVITHRGENNITYKLDRNRMTGLLVKDKTTIFVSQYENPGSIFKYDTVRGTSETVVEGLNKPTFISRMYTPEGYRYIVTEEGLIVLMYTIIDGSFFIHLEIKEVLKACLLDQQEQP